MIKDIEAYGCTNRCPVWNNSLIEVEETVRINRCVVCVSYFKRLDFGMIYGYTNRAETCPCDNYTKSYLIGFLKKVISNSMED